MFENRKILVVEDNSHEIQNITKLLGQLGIDYAVATNLKDALDVIARHSFDFLLSDLHIETKAGFEKPDGLTVIRAAREQQPNITIVATSSDPRTEIWNDALQAGAHHFIRKPFSIADEFEIAFGLARERKVLISESDRITKPRKPTGRWKQFAKGYPYGVVIGDRELRRIQGIARRTEATFLITGETGTGKEEVAKLVHRFRSEKEGAIPFVAVNCATISGNLSESLLFGHRKGAFTGADQTTIGYIGEADGGILFLDEIQTLEISTQQKLLRVLNDGTYNRLGETKVCRSRFQLIAASTKDLDDEVDAGRFLLDIRSRMMGLDIRLPPLRDRREDIPALIALYLSKKDISITDSVFDELAAKLQTFYWAGNIRQLFKALEAWILTCEFDDLDLTVGNFPIFKGMQEPRVGQSTKGGDSSIADSLTYDFAKPFREDLDLEIALTEYERHIIASALKRHTSIADSCRALNVSRSTFDARRRKHGLI